MLFSQKKQDIFYCNHWADDCFYMVFRPIVFEGSVMYGTFTMMICGDMDTLHLTSQVMVMNNKTVLKDICYEYSSSLTDDLTENDFKKEKYYDSAVDVISCMFGDNIEIQNTVSDNYLVENSIWKEMETVVECYYLSKKVWGEFQLLDYYTREDFKCRLTKFT